MAEIELLAAPDLLNPDISFLGVEGWIPLSRDPNAPTLKDLPPKTYQVLPASANPCPFKVTVTDDGTVQYDAEFEGILAGAGTNRLTFNGLPVTIDARYISGIQVDEEEFAGGGAGTQFLLGAGGHHPIVRHQECRILPQKFGYGIVVGPSRMAPFTVFLDHQTGHWSYGVVEEGGEFVEDPKFDISQGGFLAGRGTTTLEIYGYPCIVDARASGSQRLQIIGVINKLKSTDTLVQYLNVLPIGRNNESYQVLLGDGVTERGFQVTVHGELVPIGPGVTIDTFHRVPRVRIIE